MKHFFITILFLICLPTVYGQIYHLSLEESIEIAKKQSFDIQNLMQTKIIAENELKATTASLKTRVDMNFTLPQYTETIREWQDSTGISYFPIKTLQGTSYLNINQPLPTSGNISIRTGLSSTNDYNTNRRASQFNTIISLRQSLNSLWGYNDIQSQLKTARLNYERANKAYKREELNLVYIVSNAFYDLLLNQKQTEIAQMTFERWTDAHKISKDKYAAGLIREVENLQTEVELAFAQNTYDVSKTEHQALTNSFKRLIGLELDATVTLKSEMTNYSTVTINPNKAVEMALMNRLEIKDSEIGIELQKIQISRQKSAGQPQANLVASWEKTGVSNINRAEAFSNSLSGTWDNLLDRPANYQVGFTLSVPIIDWGRNKRLVRSAEARLKQTYLSKTDLERSIEVEVRNLVANLETTLQRLQSSEKNLSVAERSYSITFERFNEGDITPQDMSLEMTRLNTAQQNHLSAFVRYRLQLADLMRRTFYDFENDKPIE